MTAPVDTWAVDWGIIIASGGLIVNLSFNIVNFIRTTSLKKGDLRVEEFKRLRARLDGALDELIAQARAIQALSRSATTGAVWQKQLEAKNKLLTEADSKVMTILTEMNDSPFASGNGWLTVGTTEWDNALSTLNGGYNTTLSIGDRKNAIADSAQCIEARVRLIKNRVSDEMSSYAKRATKRRRPKRPTS